MSASLKWIVALALLSMPVLYVLIEGDFGRRLVPPPTIGEQEAINIAQRLILQSVRSPEVAQFPTARQAFQVEMLGKDHWRVASHVDTVNSLKTPVRLQWSIEFQRQAGDRWQMVRQKIE